ncbi:hypothetical protein FEM48_Zijuj01G0090100 [Ziziphus jujuba var. spinosa]|uniref:Phosphoglycolate phosphatase n=1 Tax=Ziziphus jujuba var. spinosa TaxID=714518 RepID=A0A978W0C1_ZIZJJ|nr:hypothetical protein FEM48_Zijuj01G0090100 [Ziziphus jujuba var. spinosa]
MNSATASKSTSRLLAADNLQNLLDSVDAFLFDCDGKEAGVRYEQFHKIKKAIRPKDEMFSSSFAAAMFLKVNNFPKDKKVYVIGEEGILEELKLAGFTGLGGPVSSSQFFFLPIMFLSLYIRAYATYTHSAALDTDGNIALQEDGKKTAELKPNHLFEHDKSVGAVVVGLDRYINYYKLQYGTLCIRENPGCLFIATNRDAVGHMTNLQEWPGAGCMVAAICGTTEKEPIVVGKPSTFLMDFLIEKFHISCSRMCMVGDRLDTDILFGQNAGCKTLLVLSGVTNLTTLQDDSNKIIPDYYTSKVSDIFEFMGP